MSSPASSTPTTIGHDQEPSILTMPAYNIANRLRPEDYKQCRRQAMENVFRCEHVGFEHHRPLPPENQLPKNQVLNWLSSDRASFLIESSAHTHMLIENLFDATTGSDFKKDKFPDLGTSRHTQKLFTVMQIFKTCEWFVLSAWASIALRESRKNPSNTKAKQCWVAFKLAVDYNRPLTFKQKCEITNNNYCSYVALFASNFNRRYAGLIAKLTSRKPPNLKFQTTDQNLSPYEEHDLRYMHQVYGMSAQDLLKPSTHFCSVLDGHAIFSMPLYDEVHMPSEYYAQFARESAHIGKTDFFANCRLKWTRSYPAPQLDLPAYHLALKNVYGSLHLCLQNQTELGIEAYVSLMNSLADYFVVTSLPVLKLLAEAGPDFRKVKLDTDFKLHKWEENSIYRDFKHATNQATLAASGFTQMLVKSFEYFKAYYMEGWSAHEALSIWKSTRELTLVPECIYGMVAAGLFMVPTTHSYSMFEPVWRKINDCLLSSINNELRSLYTLPFAGNLNNTTEQLDIHINMLPYEYTHAGRSTSRAAILFNDLTITLGYNYLPILNIQQMLSDRSVKIQDILKYNEDNIDIEPRMSGVVSGVKDGFLTLFSASAMLAFDIFGTWKTGRKFIRPQTYACLPIDLTAETFASPDETDLIILQLNNAVSVGGYVRHRLENNILRKPMPEFEVVQGRLSTSGKRVNIKNLARLATCPWTSRFPEDKFVILYVIELFHTLLRNTLGKINHEIDYTEFRLAARRDMALPYTKIISSAYLHCYLHQFVPENVRKQIMDICSSLDLCNIDYQNDRTPEMALMTNPVIAKFIIDLENGVSHIKHNLY